MIDAGKQKQSDQMWRRRRVFFDGLWWYFFFFCRSGHDAATRCTGIPTHFIFQLWRGLQHTSKYARSLTLCLSATWANPTQTCTLYFLSSTHTLTLTYCRRNLKLTCKSNSLIHIAPKLCSMCCTTICTHTQAKANRLKNWSQKYDMKKTYSADLMTQWDCKICMADSYFQLELPLYTSCCTALHTWAQSICLSVSYTLMSLPVELSLASWPTPVHSASPSLPSFICGTFLLSR